MTLVFGVKVRVRVKHLFVRRTENDKDLKLLPPPTAVAGVGFLPTFVCLSVYLHNISKTDAAIIESPN